MLKEYGCIRFRVTGKALSLKVNLSTKKLTVVLGSSSKIHRLDVSNRENVPSAEGEKKNFEERRRVG